MLINVSAGQTRDRVSRTRMSIREQLEEQADRLLRHAAELEPTAAAPLVLAAASAVAALGVTQPTVRQALAQAERPRAAE